MWKPGEEQVSMLMSVEDAAPIIGLGVKTLKECMDDQLNPLPHVIIGGSEKKHRRVNMAHVQEWLDKRTIGLPGTTR